MTLPSGTSTISYALAYSTVAGMPILLALLCCTRVKKTAGSLLPWATVPALLVAIFCPLDEFVDVPWFFMGGRMGLDETGRIFLVLSAFIWLLAAFSANRRLRVDHKHSRFNGFFLTAMAGNFGLILAQGMLGYYLFFALMSFSTYGLVAHTQTEESRKAGRIYLRLVMIGEVALFIALVIMARSLPNLFIGEIGHAPQPMTLLLLFIGFGVKIGALPFHSWMPLTYQATPIPAATALAGAMVNAGLLGWLRFLPLGHISCPREGLLFVLAGAIAAFYGVIIGLGHKKPGAILACSSISQMGLMTVIFGLGLLTYEAGEQAASILIIYAVHHSLAKSCLFLGYDSLESRTRRPSNLQLAMLLIAALALTGLPLTSGAIAKTGFKELAHFIGEPWLGLSQWFLPLSAAATTMLVVHFIHVLYRTKNKHHSSASSSLLPFAASFLVVISALWLWPAARVYANHSLAGLKIWQSLWPVVLGFLLFSVWHRLRAKAKGHEDAPTPDNKKLRKGLSNVPHQPLFPLVHNWAYHHMHSLFPAVVLQLRKTEKIMGRWTIVGLSYLLLCLIVLFLLD